MPIPDAYTGQYFLSTNDLYPLRHPRDTKLSAELAPLTTGPFPHGLREIDPVALPVRLLDSLHVDRVPVEADESRDEQFASEAILSRSREGVVEEQGISDGSVDDAVENMS